MTGFGTTKERLEVFCYTWPFWWEVPPLAALVSLCAAGAIIIDSDTRIKFGNSLGAWGFPVEAALIISGLLSAVWLYSGCQSYRERFKRVGNVPSLVVDRSGFTTDWSIHIAWDDVKGFAIARGYPRRGIMESCPGVLVSDIKRYKRPLWCSKLWYLDWRPENALPLLKTSKVGYVVRNENVEGQRHVDMRELMDELRKFRG